MDILESSNEPETVSEDNSELHSINKEQKALIEKLKAEVEKLKREKKELQAQAADAEEPYDCLYHILSHYQETNTDQFNDTFSLIKGNSYATTVSKLQKDLSLDEE
jgi:predicted RNase H-like nuclease (RuvC/YqgF family)